MKQKKLLNELMSEWSVRFILQPKNTQERHDVIEIQYLKKEAAKEIMRLQGLIDDKGES